MTYRRTDLSNETREALLANLANQYRAIEEMTGILGRALVAASELGLRDREIADRLGVSRTTVMRWRQKGKGPVGTAGTGDQGAHSDPE